MLVLEAIQQEETVAILSLVRLHRLAVAVAGRNQVWLEILVVLVAVEVALLVQAALELLIKDLPGVQTLVAAVAAVLGKQAGQMGLGRVVTVIFLILLALLYSVLVVVEVVVPSGLDMPVALEEEEMVLEIVASAIPVKPLKVVAVAVVEQVLLAAQAAAVS